MSVDFRSFMSSLTRTFSSNVATPKYVGQNLAVISKEYANISLRLGYHFNIIDFYCSENINDNHAYFRFFGGVTEPTRRERRAAFLARVLHDSDFRVELRGDLVIARLKKLPPERMEPKIYLLGLLVAYTRQIDVRMITDNHINGFVSDFKQMISTVVDANQMAQLGLGS